MKLSTPYLTKKPRIELIPLIDVMFFLLASFIFVSLSMIHHRGIRVDVPQAASGQPDRKEYFAISMAADSKLYINKRLVSEPELRHELSTLLQRETDPRIYINADKRVAHGDVINVLDIVRAVGVKRVSFEVKPIQAAP